MVSNNSITSLTFNLVLCEEVMKWQLKPSVQKIHLFGITCMINCFLIYPGCCCNHRFGCIHSDSHYLPLLPIGDKINEEQGSGWWNDLIMGKKGHFIFMNRMIRNIPISGCIQQHGCIHWELPLIGIGKMAAVCHLTLMGGKPGNSQVWIRNSVRVLSLPLSAANHVECSLSLNFWHRDYIKKNIASGGCIWYHGHTHRFPSHVVQVWLKKESSLAVKNGISNTSELSFHLYIIVALHEEYRVLFTLIVTSAAEAPQELRLRVPKRLTRVTSSHWWPNQSTSLAYGEAPL